MKSLPAYWCLMCAVAAGAGGWFLGRKSWDAEDASPAVTSVRAQGAGPASGKPARIAPKADVEAGSPGSAMMTALRNPDRIQRIHHFLTALEGMTAENMESYRTAWTECLAQGVNDPAVESLINFREGEVHGAVSLVKRTGSPADFTMIGSINTTLAGAMRTDPEGVRKWYDSLTNEKFRERMLGGYVSALAGKDLTAAVEVMDKIDPQFQAQCAGSILSGLRSSKGADEVSAWVRTVMKAPEYEQSPWRNEVFRQAVSQSAFHRQGAYIAAGLLEEFAGQPCAEGIDTNRIAAKFASWEPVRALDWAARIEPQLPGTDAGSLISTAISNVADQELRSAAGWCRGLPAGPQRDAALHALINRSSAVDAALTAELQALLEKQ